MDFFKKHGNSSLVLRAEVSLDPGAAYLAIGPHSATQAAPRDCCGGLLVHRGDPSGWRLKWDPNKNS